MPEGSTMVVMRSPRGAPGASDEFTVAVREHHRSLARLAYRLCGDEQRAEDAVAEAYARVWPKWQRGQVDDLDAYLRRAVVNHTYGGLRRRLLERREAARQSRELRSPQFDAQVSDHDQLWRALGCLPHTQRTVLVLRLVEDLSEEETAALLGVPAGTVKSRLSRSLAAMRALVREDDDA